MAHGIDRCMHFGSLLTLISVVTRPPSGSEKGTEKSGGAILRSFFDALLLSYALADLCQKGEGVIALPPPFQIPHLV